MTSGFVNRGRSDALALALWFASRKLGDTCTNGGEFIIIIMNIIVTTFRVQFIIIFVFQVVCDIGFLVLFIFLWNIFVFDSIYNRCINELF